MSFQNFHSAVSVEQFGNVYFLSFSPQLFKIIEIARFAVKYMNNYRCIVHYYPACLIIPLDMSGMYSHLGELFLKL